MTMKCAKKRFSKPDGRPLLSIILLLLLAINLVGAQEKERTDFNSYYAFPFSMGAGYRGMTPFSSYGSDFNVYEISGLFHLPLQRQPRVHPFLEIGVAQYDSRNYKGDGDRWDHSQLYSGLGAAFINRFSKNFEAGLDISCGGAFSFFDEFDEGTSYTLPYVYGSAGGRLALDPSYNMSISLRPGLKYQYAIQPDGVNVDDFDGMSLSIGVSIHYRFGEDPDASSSMIRNFKLEELTVSSLFAAMQSYYIDNPFGTARFENTGRHSVKNLTVSFFQQGLMDAPTLCHSLDSVEPGEIVEIPLFATFNDKVFVTEGIKPYTGEIILQYEVRNRTAEQKSSVSYDLYDRNSLTWDDDRKVAAFITPSDSALRNYSSFVRQSSKDHRIGGFSNELQEAMQIYEALGVQGCLYQSDPSSPFVSAQGDTQTVDSISLPRETLKRATGDCDDLTVLYCSLLETLGVETAFLTIPGHIYAAFNTKVPSSKYDMIHSERDMTISLDGELWVPVEITLIGSEDFTEAWRTGASQWNALKDKPETRRFYRTADAQQIFRPIGLTETDLGLRYGNPDEIASAYKDDLDILQKTIFAAYEEKVRSRGKKQDYNKLGVRYSMFNRLNDARRAFEKAIALDSDYLPSRINKASLEMLKGRNREAIAEYNVVLKILMEKGKGETLLAGRLLLNLARSYYEIEEHESARSNFEKARQIVPEESTRFSFIAASETGVLRASSAARNIQPLYIGDDYDE